MASENEERPVVVGTCRCGGYGVVYDEEAQVETGVCHQTLDEVLEGTPHPEKAAAEEGTDCGCGMGAECRMATPKREAADEGCEKRCGTCAHWAPGSTDAVGTCGLTGEWERAVWTCGDFTPKQEADHA